MRRALGLLGGAALVLLLAVAVWFVGFGSITVGPAGEVPATVESGPAGPPRAELSPAREDLPPVRVGQLTVPVLGVTPGALVDTFTQARAGGARRHDAIDIPAPAGTPVVAAAPGIVEKLFLSERGGLTVYVRSRDRGLVYYYAHLAGYADGLAEGDHIARGDRIGFVGSTGNADPRAPHLHFAVMRMRPGESWWDGVAVNPYPLLAGPRLAGSAARR